MKPSPRIFTPLAAASLLAASSCDAANQTWNPASSANVLWSASALNSYWGTATTTGQKWTNTTTSNAIFGDSVSQSLQISAGGITVHNMTFSTDGYEFNPVDATSILTLAGTTPTVTANNGSTVFFWGEVAGTAGLTVKGDGFVLLGTGEAPATFSGPINVVGAYLEYASGTPNHATITTASGASTQWDQTVDLAASWMTTNNVVSGAGGFSKYGDFTLNTDNGTGKQFKIQQSAGALFGLAEGTIKQGPTSGTGFNSTNKGSLDSGDGAVLDLNGNTATVDALTGTGTITNTAAGTVQALTIGVANDISSQDNLSDPGSAEFDGEIDGNLSLTKSGTGTQILTGGNTYTGDTLVSAGTLILSGDPDFPGTGALTFKIGANGVTNQVKGTGSATFDGAFFIDLTTANTTIGNTWTLVNVATLHETFGPNFNVDGFAGSAHVWTKVANGRKWTFTEATGTLTVGPTSINYATWATAANITGQPASGDFDHDGQSNGLEYALGSDPRLPSGSAGVLAGDVLTFTKGAEARANGDVTYIIEKSHDLGMTDPWTPVVTHLPSNTDSTISCSVATGRSADFFRLRVVIQ